jgi:hypothetical protein
MQAQVPPSVRSSKYRKYGAFPAVASILATCISWRVFRGGEQIENWIFICPKSAAVCKEAYKYHASLQIGTDKCFGGEVSLPWNLYHEYHVWGDQYG